jgi:hypothetical protein
MAMRLIAWIAIIGLSAVTGLGWLHIAEPKRTTVPMLAPPTTVAAPAPAARTPLPGKVAIVLSGLGLRDDITRRAVDETPAALALAFSPYADGLADWAERARARGHEVLMELPVRDSPDADEGPRALAAGLSVADNRARLQWALSRVRAADGLLGAVFAPERPGGAVRVTSMAEAVLEATRSGVRYVDIAANWAGKGEPGGADIATLAPASGAGPELADEVFQRRAGIVILRADPRTLDALPGLLAALNQKGLAPAPLSAFKE